jgi:hypothetical protein
MNKEHKDSDIKSITDFDELLELVKADNGLVDNLTEEQVTQLRKNLNPYGRSLKSKSKLTCLSITNLREQYERKYLMTSLIAFLYRQCDEYSLSEGEPVTSMDDFDSFMIEFDRAITDANKSISLLEKVNKKDHSIENKAFIIEHNRIIERGEGFKKRLLVRQFLDSLFQFNPDMHVKSAYADNPLDPERVKPEHIKRKTKNNSTDKRPSKSKTKDTKRSNSYFVKHIPPKDTFHRWRYYTDTNHEEIRSAVCDLYCEKPDLEFAINPYEQFNTEEDASRYVQKHKNEVITDVVTLTNGKWNLLGSFKKNRERINFYNEKTAVIEEIFKQIEQDKKLGADLMRKRVKRNRNKNKQEVGEDSKEFKEYRQKNTNAVESMGAMRVGEDDRDTKEDDVLFRQHEDCPYDSVQVDVFDFRKGGKIVKKSEFFTQAEDPKTTEQLRSEINKDNM